MRILSRSISQKTIHIIQKIERFSRLKERLLDFPVFKEGCTFLVYWNFIMLVSIIYNFYTIPLRIIYTTEYFQSECYLKPLIFIQFIIFVFDILIQCNTIIIIQDEIIYNRKRIFLTYIKSRRVVIDLVSLCGCILASRPFYYEQCDLKQSKIEIFLNFIFYVKYLKFSKLYRKLE